MPPRQNAARIDPAVWESCRKEIYTYYMQEDKSLNGLISYMKDKKNFHATKPQYERQLASWKFRKNLTSEEWVFAIDRMEKRKRDGKETALFVEGFEIPTKRIKKEISRHSLSNKIPASEQVKTPEGISIRTPQAHAASCAAVDTSLENLPWIKFQNHTEPRGNYSTAYPFINSLDAETHITAGIGHTLSFGDTTRRDTPGLAQLSYSIQETEMPSILSTSVPTLVRHTSGLIDTIVEQDLVGSIPSILQLPDAILESQGDIAPHGSINRHPLPQVAKPILDPVSNNLLQDGLGEGFLQLIIERKQESVLASLFKEKTPTTESFARFTFKHALSIQDTSILRICLQAGVDPNIPIPHWGPGYPSDWRPYTPLEISICHHGNIELAKVLLDAGAHTNGLLSFGWKRFSRTAISALTAHFNIELAKLLLNLSAGINAAGCWGGPVLRAAAKDNVEPIQTLLKAGLSAWRIMELGEIALVAAVADHNIELVQILLESGVDVNAFHSNQGTLRGTALEVATAHSHIELVQILLGAGANVNAIPTTTFEGYVRGTVLQTAAGQGNIKLVRILLGAGANVNAPPCHGGGETALQAAAEGGNIELVQILLHAGTGIDATPADFRWAALQSAADEGNIEVVRILLGASTDANAPPGNIDKMNALAALQTAAQRGDNELVRVLLDACADANAHQSGMTTLEAAALGERNSIELVRALLDAGADVNAPGSEKTALQHAVTSNRIELVRLLLHAGADVNANESGVTALAVAVLEERNRQNGIELVQILLDAGANTRVNCSVGDVEEWTILQAAVVGGNIELVRALLDSGADVNAPAAAGGGRTALQAAAEGGSTEMVQFLLSEKADVNALAAHERGITALQGAAIRGDLDIAILLLKAGAGIIAAPAISECGSVLEGYAEHGRLDAMQLLLGASAGTEGPGGRRVSEAAILAGREGHYMVARSLIAIFDRERHVDRQKLIAGGGSCLGRRAKRFCQRR